MKTKTGDRKTAKLVKYLPKASSLKELIEQVLSHLEPQEAELLRLRLGMSGKEEQSLEELRLNFKISLEEICKIEAKARRVLRKITLKNFH